MVIRGPGGVGRQLGAEHSQRLESYFQSIPGVQLVACSTAANAKALLKSAIRSDNPVIFFEHVLLYNVKGEMLQHACSSDMFLSILCWGLRGVHGWSMHRLAHIGRSSWLRHLPTTGETKDGYYQPLEKAEMVRSGGDVTILCYSRMRYVVMQAVAQLEKEGYDPEVGCC